MAGVLGIASTSFAGVSIGGAAGNTPGQVRPPDFDTLSLLERCHRLGAAGIQAEIHGDPRALRKRAEQLDMWIEAMIPAGNGDLAALEHAILVAKDAGCTVARDGLLAGRRYQTFTSYESWCAWKSGRLQALKAAVPLFEKHKLTLALENHKDWTLEEYIDLLQKYSSDYFGSCIDFGNNLSLLDNPFDTIAAAAPFVKATHVKDIAIEPYGDGFLLSEVVLGSGIIDVKQVAAVLKRSNPSVRFSLEMITRDPLQVPCLTDGYWITFPERSGLYLARTLRFLAANRSAAPLPRVDHLVAEKRRQLEEDNVKACLRIAHESNLLA